MMFQITLAALCLSENIDTHINMKGHNIFSIIIQAMKTNRRKHGSFGPCDVHVGFPKFDRWPTLTLLATVAISSLKKCIGQ
jgi:hypothetical protein